MYTYINVSSISIFLMSLYMLYASWSINKTKRNAILVGMLVIIISSKVLSIISIGNSSLNYIYEITIVLLIIQLNIKINKNKLYRIVIFINYILVLVSLVLLIFNGDKLYITIINVYIFMATLYLSINITSLKEINKMKIVLIILIDINILISLIVNENETFINITSILDISSSIYVFLKLFKGNISDIYNTKQKVRDKLNKSYIRIEKYNESLKVDKQITNIIYESIGKKQDLLQTIVGEYNRCIFIIDNEGYILNEDNSFSKIWKEYSDYKYKINLDTFINNSIKNANNFIDSINKVKQYGLEVHGELIGKDGRFFECSYLPFFMSNKQMYVICSIVDITYQKKSEIKIKENNMKYKKIVENIPYSILITDGNDILYNNDKNDEIDYHSNEIKNIIVDKSINGELYYTLENQDGMYLNIDRVRFDDEENERNLVVIRDITNYKKILKEVDYSKKKYEALVNVIPEGIYIANYEDKSITYSNQIFSEVIDKTSLEDIKSNYINESMTINSGKNNENIKFTRKQITNKYGENINIECGSMLIDVNDRLKVIGIIRDITEQVKAENIEREIEAKKKENKIKTDFFVNMSHELKTPLNVILSSNQLLELMNKNYINKNPNSEISKSIYIVKKHSYILMGLINNIIDLAKLESKFHESKMDYYNIVSVIEDVCVEFNKYIKVNNIDILFDTDEEERIANVDPNDIEKIILTLLSMIIRYSYTNSRIYVDLSNFKNKTIITIKNEGGYDYNRYINDQERKGLDIGITVVKSMIELYKGNIDINTDYKDNIKISIEIEINEDVDSYKKRMKSNGDNFIYEEYLRMCNF